MNQSGASHKRQKKQGVIVEKSPDFESFPIHAFKLKLQSTRAQAVDVTIIDPLPDIVNEDDVGFHTDYGKEYFSIDENSVRLSTTLNPSTELEAIYGIRGVSNDELESTITQPRIVVSTSEDSTSSQSIQAATAQVDEDDDDSLTNGESVDASADPLDASRDTAAAARNTIGRTGEDAPRQETERDESEVTAEGSTHKRTDSHLDAAEAGEATELEPETTTPSGSTRAQLQYLHKEISDIQAYTAALEEFLEDQGSADVLGELQREMQSMRQTLGSVETQLGHHDTEISTIKTTTENLKSRVKEAESTDPELESRVQGTETKVDQLRADVDSLTSEVVGVETRIESLETTLKGVEATIDDVVDMHEQLQGVFQADDL